MTCTVGAFDLDPVDQAELDEVEPELGVDHVRERFLDFFDGDHRSSVTGRSLRAMPLLVLAVVIGLPIIELYVIIRVGEAIGPFWTVAALVATSVIGVRLVRSQGRAVLRDFARGDRRRPATGAGGPRRGSRLRGRAPADRARLHHRRLRRAAPAPADAGR